MVAKVVLKREWLGSVYPEGICVTKTRVIYNSQIESRHTLVTSILP